MTRRLIPTVFAVAAAACAIAPPLTNPDSPRFEREAPPTYRVKFETNRGPILIEAHRDWGPRGADRFYHLVRAGYYDDNRFFRVVKGRWAQFGINGDPKIATLWRTRTIPDDPKQHSNVRGTVTFAFAEPNGRATQVYLALANLSDPQDAQGFVPFGEIVGGMDTADALNAEYGETSGSGIRAGKQQPLFDGGNAFLDREFPRLDRIYRALVGSR
jgi:cyclophilin family peptidyl-prolyl cis-trans isomerase